MNTTGNDEIVVSDLSGGKAGKFYILDEHKNVVALPHNAILQWGQWFENRENRRVARNETGDTSVSTVFLGVDHGFSEGGPPIVFETMVFGGPMDQHTVRYSTWEAAQRGHVETCRKVFA